MLILDPMLKIWLYRFLFIIGCFAGFFPGLVIYFFGLIPVQIEYMKRHKISKKNSKRIFNRGVRVKAKNYKPVMRGGTRL